MSTAASRQVAASLIVLLIVIGGLTGLAGAVRASDTSTLARLEASPSLSIDKRLDLAGTLTPEGRVRLIAKLNAGEKSALWTAHLRRWRESGILSESQQLAVAQAERATARPGFFEPALGNVSSGICQALADALPKELSYAIRVQLGSAPTQPTALSSAWRDVASLLASLSRRLVPTARAKDAGYECTCTFNGSNNCCPSGCSCRDGSEGGPQGNQCDNFANQHCGCLGASACTGFCGTCS